jgi:hypothetical protein
MSHGQNEQHEGWNGLIAMIATDIADSPEIDIPGEAFPPSQVYKGGKTRKSSDTTSFSMDRCLNEAYLVVALMPGAGGKDHIGSHEKLMQNGISGMPDPLLLHGWRIERKPGPVGMRLSPGHTDRRGD